MYNLRPQDVAIAMGALVAGAAGIVVGWSSRRLGPVVLTMGVVVLGVIAIVSFGVLMLVVVALTVPLVLTSARRPDRRVVSAGALLGIGALVLALTALSPPLIECANGSSAGDRFLASGSSSGTATASARAPADSLGHARGDSYEYSYTCRNGQLVEFTLRQR